MPRTSAIVQPSITIESATSLRSIRQPRSTETSGPTVDSSTTESGPITTGPRSTLRVTLAPAADHDRRPPPWWLRRPRRRSRGSRTDSIIAVGLEQVVGLAGVLPPALDHLGADRAPVVDQPLDRLGDLVLAAPRRLQRVGGLEDRVVEQVDADERQVAHVLASASRPGARPGRRRAPPRRTARARARAPGRSARRAASARTPRTNRLSPSSSTLSPRYIRNGWPATKSRAVITACARPSGASCWM